MSDAAKLADEREWIAGTIFKYMVHPDNDPHTNFYAEDWHYACLAADVILLRSLPREAELRRALEPFVEYLKQIREHFPDQESTPDTIIVGGPYNLTRDHFYNLEAALSSEGQEKK